MAEDSTTDDYYPFRWKVADAVEDMFLLHRSKVIGVIALLGLGFILVGFLLLGWGGTTSQTDTAAPTTTTPPTTEATTTAAPETTTPTTAAPVTTTEAPTTTAAAETTTEAPTTTVSARAATPEQLASTEAGSVITLTPTAITVAGGLEDDAAADAIVALVSSTFADVAVDDQLVVDQSYAGADGLTFRLSAPDLFGYNSDVLNPNYFSLIDQLAGTLGDEPDWQVEVSGHTDDSGPADGNLRLSERRAASAAQRLISQGVDLGRVTSVGRGESEPIADNGSEAGRLANRRVEFDIIR